MNFDKETLDLIQRTAVKAESIKEYKTGHRERTLIWPDGKEKILVNEQPQQVNTILTIEDAVRIFKACSNASIWVSPTAITVVHDNDERYDFSKVVVEMTRTAQILLEADDKENWMKPELFEKIALLRFGADEVFIDRLRNLQWNVEGKESSQLSNISKSTSSSMLAKVLEKNGSEFKDVWLTVTTPIFDVPCKTKEIEVEVQILANAEVKGICFAPRPGVMQENIREATRELYGMVCDQVTDGERDRVFMGTPVF